MRVERLEFEDWRNLEHATVEFVPGLNLVVGRNAQGKTNILEAVHHLSGLGSPRGPESAVVRDGAERALLHAAIVRGERHLSIDMEIKPGRGTRALLNKTALPATRSLSEVVTSVYFGPDELAIVKGSPEARRSWLDDVVVKLRPARLEVRREWERVLKQRNALLRTAGRPAPAKALSTLEVWDESLARAGAALTFARFESLATMAPAIAKRYEAIAGAGRIELAYSSSWVPAEMAEEGLAYPGSIPESDIRDALMAAVVRERPRELERGMSLVGPQRDDVVIRLSAGEGILDARSHASQGDQRTCALALKLGEFDALTEAAGQEPILLLDDVFSELDPRRRAWLADAVRDREQTILTSAEPGALEAAGATQVLEVEAGRVRVASDREAR